MLVLRNLEKNTRENCQLLRCGVSINGTEKIYCIPDLLLGLKSFLKWSNSDFTMALSWIKGVLFSMLIYVFPHFSLFFKYLSMSDLVSINSVDTFYERLGFDFFLNLSLRKSVLIRSYSGPYFSPFGLNTERYKVSLRVQSERGKIWTRTTPNTDTFHVVFNAWCLLKGHTYLKNLQWTPGVKGLKHFKYRSPQIE